MAKKTALVAATQSPSQPNADAWLQSLDKKGRQVETETARLVVEIPVDIHRQLKSRCGAEGLTIKDVVNDLLAGYLAGKIKPS